MTFKKRYLFLTLMGLALIRCEKSPDQDQNEDPKLWRGLNVGISQLNDPKVNRLVYATPCKEPDVGLGQPNNESNRLKTFLFFVNGKVVLSDVLYADGDKDCEGAPASVIDIKSRLNTMNRGGADPLTGTGTTDSNFPQFKADAESQLSPLPPVFRVFKLSDQNGQHAKLSQYVVMPINPTQVKMLQCPENMAANVTKANFECEKDPRPWYLNNSQDWKQNFPVNVLNVKTEDATGTDQMKEHLSASPYAYDFMFHKNQIRSFINNPIGIQVDLSDIDQPKITVQFKEKIKNPLVFYKTQSSVPGVTDRLVRFIAESVQDFVPEESVKSPKP